MNARKLKIGDIIMHEPTGMIGEVCWYGKRTMGVRLVFGKNGKGYGVRFDLRQMKVHYIGKI